MPNPLINIGAAVNDGTGELGPRGWLQKVNRLPNTDSTINAGSGDYVGTTEQKITAAIAAAVLSGAKYVWVPQSMLPFNASLVAFNNGIQMLREGGNPHLYDVWAYGANHDSVTNDSPAIQAAINGAANVATTSGGIVFMPDGSYAIGSTLTISGNEVFIYGGGAFYSADIGTNPNGGTILRWVGGPAGPIMKFAPIEGAANQALKGVRAEGFSLDGTSNATIGLQILSCQGSQFQQLYIQNCTTVALDGNVVTTLGENRGLTRCWFERIAIRQLDGAGGNGMGIRLDGDATANTSNNNFELMTVTHLNGIGIKLLNCDSNRFIGTNINRGPGGTAIGVELNGSNVSDAFTARVNVFYYLSAVGGGLTARATGLTFPSRNNQVYCYGTANGEPLPVIEAPTLGGTPSAGFEYSLDTRMDESRVSGDRGDNSVTLIFGSDAPVQKFGTTLTANRTCTLNNQGVNATALPNGARFRISNTASGSGFNVLTIQDSTPTTIVSLRAHQWCDVMWDTAWRVVALGHTALDALYVGVGTLGSPTTSARASAVLFQDAARTTTSTSDVSLSSFSLPGGSLGSGSHMVRILMRGVTVAQNCIANVKFGATVVVTGTVTTGNVYEIEVIVVRTGATNQTAIGTLIQGGAVTSSTRTSPTETLANAITIDFRGSVTAGGTLGADQMIVEYLAA